jgi:undecaprenyl diphosphate synthase
MTEISYGAAPVLSLPRHVGIIMDGNGRWAAARSLPRLAGHRAGVENVRNVVRACAEFGVQTLTLYAFSTENWNRPRDEVRGLLGLIDRYLARELDELDRSGVQLHHLGGVQALGASTQRAIQNAIERTSRNDKLVLNIAFNYGGRAEITQAVRRLLQDGFPPEDITEAHLAGHLYTAGQPDPDLIIRTGGEMRLSNF